MKAFDDYRVCFNFLVCQAQHQTHTIPLTNYLKNSNFEKLFPNSEYFLLGGFETIDKIPITKISETDDYLSAIPKTLNLFKLHKNTNFDWYFIGDDDTFINFANLKNLLLKLSTKTKALYGCIDWASPTVIGDILHAHGGSGILMNKPTFNAIGNFLEQTNFSIRHHKHSDVSLALNVYAYNDSSTEKIDFIKVAEMLSPHVDINSIDPNKIVSIHTKNRMPLTELSNKLINEF